MGLIYGAITNKITSADIHSISLTSATIVTAETGDLGVDGAYQIKVTHDNCGCDSSTIGITLKDNIAWTLITYEADTTGAAACWSWNHGGYDKGDGNLYSYAENLGDLFFENVNAWEVPEFQSHNRTTACDNDANNFMRYNTDGPRKFSMKRRRNVNGSLGAISFGRACNCSGYTIIRNIRIW